MKTTKIAIIATIITIIVILSCASLTIAEAEDRGEFYPKLAVVTGYERIGDTEEWIIYLTDRDGQIWSFYGEAEDAHIGILFNMLMWNMSEVEEEDEIIEVYYEGRLTPVEIMKFLP